MSTLTLHGGRLGEMYETVTRAFLDKIDPAIHINAYVGEHSGGFAETEFAGKYLDTCVNYAKYLRAVGRISESDKALDHAKAVVNSIILNQRDDGYIGGLSAGGEANAFSVWNQAFTMLGLVSYAELTGDEAAKNAAVRIAEYNALLFMSGKHDISDGGNNGSQHLSILLPLVRLAKISDNQTVKLFAHYIVSKIKASDNNFFSFDSILDLRSKKGIENFVILIGILEYGKLYEDPEALPACEKYWDELKRTQIRENGNGTRFEVWTENGNSPAMLGLDVRPDENCVAVGWIEFSLALYFETNDPKYIDAVEAALYNHLLGALDDEGTDFAYYQPNFGRRVTKTSESMYKCCRYRGFSAASHLPDMAVKADGDTIRVMVYMNADYDDGEFRLAERSEYPYNGKVTFGLDFESGLHRTLILRVPESAKGASVLLDGKELETKHEPGEIRLSVSADGHHELEVIFDLSPEKRPVTIDGTGRIGLTYGPLLLAANASGGESFDDIRVDKTAEPIRDKDHFGFNVGGVDFTDYASAGRKTDFVVWAKTK